MVLHTKLENFISEKKNLGQDVKPKKGSMHDVLGVEPDKKISSKYKSGKELAEVLVKKVGKKKATSMINFAANISSKEDIFDKAQKELKNIKENMEEDDSYMIPQHLKSMYDKIETILQYSEKNKKIDSWVESHIIEAATKIDDVYEFVKNDHKG